MEERTTYELADVGTRFIALIIDGIILGVVTGLLVGNAGWGGGGLSFLISLFYNWYFWTRQDGQTPGKMALNIRVIKKDGSDIEDADAIIRFIGYYINSAVFLLGWVWAIFDAENQGWHDKLAGTYVVKTQGRKRKVV